MNIAKNLIIILVSLLMGAAALYLFYNGVATGSDEIADGPIFGGTILIILSLSGFMFVNQKWYNSLTDSSKIVTGATGISMDILHDAFKDLETSFGSPWLGKVKTVKGPAMIFGPHSDGQFIYISKFGEDGIQISSSMDPEWLKPSPEDEWRLDAKQDESDNMDDVIRYKFSATYMLPVLVQKISQFRDKKSADLTPIILDKDVQIYMFDEEFRWTGQDFYLCDPQGNQKMRVISQIPYKTFNFYNADSEENIFTLTKRIFHILPHYDMYANGQKIGRIKKTLCLHHDYFVADTIYGKLELKKMNAMFGSNYQVMIDGAPIGTIAEKMNLNIANVLFDNYVLTVNDPKYLVLMAAMSVMAARESRRDQVRDTHTMSDMIGD